MIRSVLLALGVGLGAGACFTAPSANVQFSCDPDDAPTCPPGYSCEMDGCCHRNGSDVDANLGACQGLGGTGAGTAGTGIPTSGGPGSGSSAGSDTGTGGASDSGSGVDTGTDTGTTGTGP